MSIRWKLFRQFDFILTIFATNCLPIFKIKWIEAESEPPMNNGIFFVAVRLRLYRMTVANFAGRLRSLKRKNLQFSSSTLFLSWETILHLTGPRKG